MNGAKVTLSQMDSYIDKYIKFIINYKIKHYFEIDVDNIFGLDRVISTHTLRGERDGATKDTQIDTIYFNSHAPWGA